MRITHQQIADKMGVSRTLVTSALHGSRSSGIKEETRVEIERVAREMGYRPRNMTTHVIAGLINTNVLKSQADLAPVLGVERTLSESGYRLHLMNPDFLSDQALAELVTSKNADGLFLTSWDGGRYRSLIKPDMPALLMSEEVNVDAGIEQVGADLCGSAEVLLRRLGEAGHKRIATLTGVKHAFNIRMANAVKEAARKLGWPQDAFVEISHIPTESGLQLVQLLKGPNAPTAALVSHVEYATSAYCALLAAGYRIPEDISLVSIFDSRGLDVLMPGVTATNIGGDALAEKSVRRLLQIIDMPENIPKQVYVPGELVERGSIAPPRRK